MAGPWFTVQSAGSDWKTLDSVWISNGTRSEKAVVQIRLELTEVSNDEIE